MATTLKIARSFGWSGTYDNSGDTGHPGAKTPIAISKTQDYTDGSSDNQVDVYISKRFTATAGTNNHDFYGGLTDIYGNTVNLAKIRGIWIHNLSTTSTELLTLGGNIMTAFQGGTTDGDIIHPSGHWIREAPIDGYTVTNTTQDTLDVGSGANTINYDLYCIGVSA